MAVESLISWCDGTLNWYIGCTEVAPACLNCYAAKFAKRTGKADWGKDGTRTLVKSTESQGRQLAKLARESGHKKIAFVSSMSDIFEDDKTFQGQWLNHKKETIQMTFGEQRERCFKLIDEHPEIHFLLLTKRPQNILKYVPWRPGGTDLMPGLAHPKYRKNVSYGTSAGTQKTWNTKVKQLMLVRDICPSTFVSCEPMLEEVGINGHGDYMPDVIFCGGESAGKDSVRPMDLTWAESLHDQCQYNGRVMFHFKQLGSYATHGGEAMTYKHPKGEDPSEWPKWLQKSQEVPRHWRARL